MEKFRQNMIKQLIQGCTECKWWILNLNAGSLAPRTGWQKRPWEELGADKAGEERQGPVVPDHVKDSNKRVCKFKEFKARVTRSHLQFSEFPSSVQWRTDHVGPVWIQGDLVGWYHSGWPLWMMEFAGARTRARAGGMWPEVQRLSRAKIFS